MSADILLIYITWTRLPARFTGGASFGTDSGGQRSFAHILRRDGTIYFVILLLMNSLHLTVTLLALQPAFEGTSYVTVFTEPITAILVSRFLLDLQSVERTGLGHTDTSTDTSGTAGGGGSLVFRFMGSLASTIDPGAHRNSILGDEDLSGSSTESPSPSDATEADRESDSKKLDEGSVMEVRRAASLSGVQYWNA
ncbi:hypothetical protein L226DRAFT_576303 [Lentinus tigrinus ALCF2SS1-7]|nr:hypothetical protein L226DRAFT_576303 [Lentinus tigrinus ALCF2SS1-7]